VNVFRDPVAGLAILDGGEDVAMRVEEPATRDELCALIVANRGWMYCRLGRWSEGVDALERAIELYGRSDRQPDPLPVVRLSLLGAQVAMGDPTGALTTARSTGDDARFVAEHLPLALALLATGDLENARPLVRAHAAQAVTGRVSREANDSLLLLSMLARTEGDDDLARRLLPEVRISRSPGTIFVTDHLAGLLGAQAELDAARREVRDDRVEGGRRALAALKSEMNRRGWSS
jgi:ATP/maltotriose-dependent transcriptional regulator MalT